jgi:predicted RNA-binding Zn ribbon-like protein
MVEAAAYHEDVDDYAGTDLDTAVLPPAPGAEQYVALAFVNTAIALPGGRFTDLVGTPDAATRWLVEQGFAPPGTGLREMCAAQIRSLREQVRVLFASRSCAEPAPQSALDAVNDALSKAPTAALLRWDPVQGLCRTAPHPVTQIVEHALAALAANAADLLTGPDAERLAACGSAPCNRFFLRNGRRQWCSVRCGDRARAARAYARRTQHEPV